MIEEGKAQVKPIKRKRDVIKAKMAEGQEAMPLVSSDLTDDEAANLALEQKAKYYKDKLEASDAIIQLPVDKIVPTKAFFNRDPSYFTSEEYIEKKNSIKKYGVLIPIEVRPIKSDDPDAELYEAIFGNTRHHIAKDLGISEIPGRIRRDCSDEELFTRSQIENTQRTDPSAWENGKRWLEIIEDNKRYPNITNQTQIAEIIGKTQSIVSKSITIYKEIPEAIADVFESKKSISFPLLELAKEIKRNDSLRRIYLDNAEIVRDLAVSDDVRVKLISDSRLFEEFVGSDEASKFVARSISIQEKLDAAHRDISGLHEVIKAADSSALDVKRKAKEDIREIELSVISRSIKEKSEIEREVLDFIAEIYKTLKEDDETAEFEKRLAKKIEAEREEEQSKGGNTAPRNPAPEPLSVSIFWQSSNNDHKSTRVNLMVSPKVEKDTEKGVRKIAAKKDDLIAEMFLQYVANNASEMIKQLISEGKLRPDEMPEQGQLLDQ